MYLSYHTCKQDIKYILEVTAASKVLRVVTICCLLVNYLRSLEVKLYGTLLRNVIKLLEMYIPRIDYKFIIINLLLIYIN